MTSAAEHRTEPRPDRGRALVLNLQRMSTEDGPGIRTTVFLKGCSLRCGWCHNPESISPRPEVVWHEWKCIGCRSCVAACPHDALAFDAGGPVTDPARCAACGTCADECPTTARERLGEAWSVDDLVAEVAKDRTYFETSGGGVTVSGGEPALRPSFVGAFMAACRGLGLHVALDTCGMCAGDALLALVDQADLVLFDLKEIDPARHARFTGQPNDVILANAKRLGEHLRARGEGGPELWIRTPLIPGATARADNLAGIGAFIAEHLGGLVTRWELCAFNHMARDKYRRLGRPNPYGDTPLMTPAEVGALAAAARRSGVDPNLVVATGPTAVGAEAPEHTQEERR